MKVLPEKVLQFGTGILLRGLPDYFIHKANQQNVFNGSILAVKSTPGSLQDFNDDGCHFTTCIRGVENNEVVKEDFVNTAISRVVHAAGQWSEVLAAARNADLQIIISNTTEVGLVYVDESIFRNPPASFPAKLTAFLYERFLQLGSQSPDTVVIPTELIPGNGDKLKEIVNLHMEHHDLGVGFTSWMEEKVIFCNSLVDRIVTRPSGEVAKSLSSVDPLAIQTEPYKLWAIEGDQRVANILTFAKASEGMVIAESIDYYRERKLRLLNGTHTLMACLGFLKGFDTVYACMKDEQMSSFIEQLMMEEILLTLDTGAAEDNRQFGKDVLERFRNPWSEHSLLSITFQATAKMKLRNVTTLLKYASKYGNVPERFAEGFAAYLFFMKSEYRDGKYYGRRGNESYLITDDASEYFYNLWSAAKDMEQLAVAACGHSELWGEDLTRIGGFAKAVGHHLMHFE